MSVSEKLSVVGDVRKALQDFLAPELGELKAQLKALSDNQKTMQETMRYGFKAQTEGRQEMESRLLREIKNSEEKLVIRIQLAEATLKLEQATRVAEGALLENERLKREKTQ